LPWLRASPAYDAAKENFYTFDLDRAKSLFEQTGVKDLSMDWLLVGTPQGTHGSAHPGRPGEDWRDVQY